MISRIPVTVITGFLGAGKTSLVRHVLNNARGKRLALIINEFGEIGVDGELLRGCGDAACEEAELIELSNGCICCTVADDFIPAMTAILQSDPLPDHIIIETSGLALPQPLLRAFNWPEIAAGVTIDGVIAVADAQALAEGRFAASESAVNALRRADEMLDHETPLGELFADQLATADMVVLNKTDLVAKEGLEEVEAGLQAKARPGVAIVRAAHGKLDPKILLGLQSEVENDLAARPSLHELDHGGEAHEHDDFDSFAIKLAPSADRADLLARLERTIRTHDILRLKGFAAISGSAARLVVQAVGPRVESWFDRPWSSEETPATSLVIIGQSPLEREAISASLKAV
ncbi:MAG: cobalamin biosynthesis protein CobW [Alphaproteobacteria bacterium]|nr:cobalamin biosynthesis protein CobW [Alphaproteobacteria bacterium]